jgi:hypothetical protein
MLGIAVPVLSRLTLRDARIAGVRMLAHREEALAAAGTSPDPG